jgi:large subunit ribosomal protein L23
MSNAAHRERLMQILIGPHVSEKSSNAADRAGRVVFKVRKDATKREISAAVEELFEVKVERVSVVHVSAKSKRFGRKVGQRAAWKKAYVRLAPGHDLNFVGAE